jgi:hypothetical protein
MPQEKCVLEKGRSNGGNAILISGAYAPATEKNLLKYHKKYEHKFHAYMSTIHMCMPSFARNR